jgi:hypothetical protein
VIRLDWCDRKFACSLSPSAAERLYPMEKKMVEITTNRARGGENAPRNMISRGLAVAMAFAMVSMFGVLLLA